MRRGAADRSSRLRARRRAARCRRIMEREVKLGAAIVARIMISQATSFSRLWMSPRFWEDTPRGEGRRRAARREGSVSRIAAPREAQQHRASPCGAPPAAILGTRSVLPGTGAGN
jgi:hypothetical protein